MNPPMTEMQAQLSFEHAQVHSLARDLVRAAAEGTGQISVRTDGEPRAVLERGGLLNRLADLRAAVERAVELEERELVPVVLEADAWGPVRVERLHDLHARILDDVDHFGQDVAQGVVGPAELAARVQGLFSCLCFWLDCEEEEIAESLRQGETTVTAGECE